MLHATATAPPTLYKKTHHKNEGLGPCRTRSTPRTPRTTRITTVGILVVTLGVVLVVLGVILVFLGVVS